jgi:hypothetical protein
VCHEQSEPLPDRRRTRQAHRGRPQGPLWATGHYPGPNHGPPWAACGRRHRFCIGIRSISARGACMSSARRAASLASIPSRAMSYAHYAARLMSDSAGIPRPSCNRQIILSVGGRLQSSTSRTPDRRIRVGAQRVPLVSTVSMRKKTGAAKGPCR